MTLLKNPQLSIDELIEIVPAPDFPTRGVIYGVSGVREGYRTGRGRIVMRVRCLISPFAGYRIVTGPIG